MKTSYLLHSTVNTNKPKFRLNSDKRKSLIKSPIAE